MQLKTMSTKADETFWLRRANKVDGSITEEPMKEHPYIYSSVHAIAQSISLPPWVTRSVEDTEGRNLTTEIQKLFDDPHPMLSTTDFFYLIGCWLMLSGECVVVKEGADARVKSFTEAPAELWPLNGRLFTRVISDETRLITHWVLNKGTKHEVVYLPHEIIHIRLPNPYNFYNGLAPLDAALISMKSDWVARKYNESFFENGADPGGILYTDQQLFSGQDEEILRKFEDRHKGQEKKDRTAILDRGLKYQQLSTTHKDMQFGEQQKWNRSEIMTVFRTPPSVMGIYEDVNYATAFEERKGYWTDVIKPYLKLISDAFWSFLYRWTDAGQTIGLSDTSKISYLQEDLDKLISQAEALTRLGFTQSQALARVGLEAENEWQDQAWTTPSVVPWEDLLYTGPELSEEEISVPIGEFDTEGLEPGETAIVSTDAGTIAEEEPTIAEQAFNGAQVTAAIGIVSQVALGELPAESAITMLMQFFNMTEEAAKAMVDPAANFEPLSLEEEGSKNEEEVLPGDAEKVEAQAAIETSSVPLETPSILSLETEESRGAYWKAQHEGLTIQQELKFDKTMRRYFMEMRAEQLDRLSSAVKMLYPQVIQKARVSGDRRRSLEICKDLPFKIDKGLIQTILFEMRKWAKKIADITRPRYKETTKKAQERLAKDISQATGMSVQEVDTADLVKRLGSEVTQINETVRNELQENLADAVEANETVGEVRKRVKAVMNVTLSRSTTIARTEVGAASERSRYILNQEMGFDKIKWISARDSHVRDEPYNHRIDGEVIINGEKFSNGLRVPHDPEGEAGNVINCRCTHVPVIEGLND